MGGDAAFQVGDKAEDVGPSAISKTPHMKGCPGSLVRRVPYGDSTVTIDRTGRVGNGGIVAIDYRCNCSWDGCPARVLVTERAVRLLAVAVEERR